MIAEQRQHEILQIAAQQAFVEVEALAGRLNVSPMTIRRDLQKLSKMGLVQRKHGGASLIGSIKTENSYMTKKALHQESKQQLAQLALELIKDNDIIYLDAGTTTFELSALLSNKQNLTVVTNDVVIALDLCKREIRTILLGGAVQSSTQTIIGPSAVAFLSSFRVTTAFLGATAIDSELDVLSPSMEKAYLKKTAMQIAQKTYLMVDSSKYNSYALHKFASLSDFTGIVTDRSFLKTELDRLQQNYVNIIAP